MSWQLFYTKQAQQDAKSLMALRLTTRSVVPHFCGLAAIAFLATTCIAAPPSVTALAPAGGQIGQTIEVTVQGAIGEKSQVWTSRDTVKVELAEAGNKFKLIVAENAAPGVCWLRFFNAEGASALRPFVIGVLPEIAEKEPNNSAAEAQKLDKNPPVVINGVLEKAGDVDTFAVTLKAGQTLIASLMAKQTLGSPMDGVLQILGPRGFVLEHNDDDHGLDPQIAFTAPADGDYAVRLFAFPSQTDSNVNFSGAATYIYRLTLSAGPFVDHVLPMSIQRGQLTKVRLHGWNLPPELTELPVEPIAPNLDSFDLRHPLLTNVLMLPVEPHPSLVEIETTDPNAAPQELLVPSSITGTISKPGEVDLFKLTLAIKQPIMIRTEARAIGSPIDPLIKMLKPDGTVIVELDDNAKGDFDPDFSFTAPSDGEFWLSITDRFNAGGSRFVYRLTALPFSSDFEAQVAADTFVLKDDKPLEIPITIDRQRGFAQEIEFSISGLPEKVTAEPVTSAKDGDSSKTVKLIVKAEPGVAFSGPIRVVGHSKSEPPVEKLVTAPLTSLTTTTSQLWLTVIAAPAK